MKSRVALCLTLLVSTTALADVLYLQDFEGDTLPGFREGGRGNLQVTRFADNASLRLTRRKTATVSLSTAGFEQVGVRLQIAADSLEKHDACYGELSVDGGATWQTVLDVRDGQDDAVTLHTGYASPESLSDNANVKIRFRAAGKDERGFCWGDNLQVTGVPLDGRPKLDDATFWSDERIEQLFDMEAFAPQAETDDPDSAETLRLTISSQTADGFQVLYDRFDYWTNAAESLARFPAVDVEFAVHRGDVVPVNAVVLGVDHPTWEIAFQAGSTWRVDDLRHVSLPFALIERNANCTHNGVMKFLIDDEGRSSRALYQIASETCAYFKFNTWGALPIEVDLSAGDATERVAEEHAQLRQRRMPVATFKQLQTRFPDVDLNNFGAVGNMLAEDTTVYGFVVDGEHYRSDCSTRAGDYPFCNELLLPSYSTAKSLFAGLALMRLEVILPGTSQKQIADLVPACDHWNSVTIEHALDMATGRYDSIEIEADEVTAPHIEFIYEEQHAAKIEAACNLFPRKSEPGKSFAYHTSDTYIAGTAMRQLLEQDDTERVDLYKTLVVDPFWKPLGLSAAIRDTRQTYDEHAQPLAGWGLFYLADDIARIGQWLLAGAPQPETSGIDQRLLKSTLQQDADDRGIETPAPGLRYNNGFWALDIADFIQCDRPVWVPFMSGFGGISVVLFPNNTLYYVFADGYAFRWREAAVASNQIRSMCR